MPLLSAITDWSPFWLTAQLAVATTLCLNVVATPLAWWLANTRSRAKPLVEALTALPLVLPATVMGFYLLILLSPTSPVGAAWLAVTGSTLTFNFSGLLVASVISSLPFAVQPLQAGFEAVGRGAMEAASVLRAGHWDSFFNVAIPLSRRSFLTAGVLTFAHTVGEFGTILMVGGAIPGRTQTLSIAVFNRVETIQYAEAHTLSALLLVFSFVVLLAVYSLNRRTFTFRAQTPRG
ncbi:MAG: molybdate ABC transporter permease subunit [Pseudomonadota bacterium]